MTRLRLSFVAGLLALAIAAVAAPTIAAQSDVPEITGVVRGLDRLLF